jgi:hypothetical protein
LHELNAFPVRAAAFDYMTSSDGKISSVVIAYLDHYLDAMGGAVLASVGCYQLEGLGIQLTGICSMDSKRAEQLAQCQT